MKKRLLSVLLATVLLLTCIPSSAVSAATSGGYTYTVSGGKATITDYTDSGGAITIPSTLGGYPVTAIGDEAFDGCKSMTSLTIPDSITTIGYGAFRFCEGLNSVTIGDSVTTIGNEAFYRCENLTSVTIGDSVTTIGNEAFSWCRRLTSVIIGESVTTIEYYAFGYCDKLTDVYYDGTCAQWPLVRISDGNNALTGNIKILSHDYAAATCTKAKTCKVCGATSGSKLGHSYEKKVTKATQTKNGVIKNVCSKCGYTASTTTTIYKASSIKLSKTSYTYDGEVKKPAVVVKDSRGKTISKSHYTVSCASGCKNAGTYKVTIKFKGNYSGTKTLTFRINPVSISKCKITLSTTSYTYNGKVKKPAVTVRNHKGTKLNTTHYTVTYASGRKNMGTYKVTVKMKGNYTGTKVLTFKINPVKTTVKSLTAGKKSLKVAITKKTAQVSGYQIQYATSKSFKSYKTKTLSGYKKTSTTLTGLSAKKTYYVRVRTYKTVNGVKYYSGWSTVKYKKTK